MSMHYNTTRDQLLIIESALKRCLYLFLFDIGPFEGNTNTNLGRSEVIARRACLYQCIPSMQTKITNT